MLTLLGPRIASLSASHVHIIQVLGVQGNCQHAPSPTPNQPISAYPLKSSSEPNRKSASFIRASCQSLTSLKGTHPVSLTLLHPGRRKFKGLMTMKTTSATFIFSSLPSALITIFLDIERTWLEPLPKHGRRSPVSPSFVSELSGASQISRHQRLLPLSLPHSCPSVSCCLFPMELCGEHESFR